jgi:hypothetical protein
MSVGLVILFAIFKIGGERVDVAVFVENLCQ